MREKVRTCSETQCVTPLSVQRAHGNLAVPSESSAESPKVPNDARVPLDSAVNGTEDVEERAATGGAAPPQLTLLILGRQFQRTRLALETDGLRVFISSPVF